MILERMDEILPGALLERHDFRGDLTGVVAVERLLEVADALFAEGFQQLLDVTAVDWPEREPRFDVIYHFLNLATQARFRLRVRVADGAPVPSLVSRYKSADWSEREVFDMFGIPFEGHPDLRRILMWKDFEGHPLRKDFPMDGGDAFCNSDTRTSYAPHAKSLQQ